MRRSVCAASFLAMIVPALAGAQAAECTNAAVPVRDACQKGTDLYTYMLPQLGLGLAGGNPVLGSSKVIGKLGHFSVGVRGTVFNGALPKTVDPSTTGIVQTNMATDKQIIGGPGIDAAIGLYGGIPLGVTHVGSVDALVSYIYIPDISKNNNSGGGSDNADIKLESHSKIGFGVRVGLVDESVVIPGVSFVYLKRGLPKLDLTNTSNSGTTFGVNRLDINAGTWRLIATKSFLLFGLSVGVGGDSYTSSGTVTATNSGQNVQFSLDRDISRTNMFADLTFNLGPAKLAAEAGRVSGGSISTFNTFDPVATAARTYYSAGLRFGW